MWGGSKTHAEVLSPALGHSPPGAELLAAEVSAMDYIPGIDMPDEGQKRARLSLEEDKAASAVQEQNAEFDEEADRLFGDGSDSDEVSEGEEDSELENGSADQERSLGHGGPALMPEQAEEDPASELKAAQIAAGTALDRIPAASPGGPSAAVLEHLRWETLTLPSNLVTIASVSVCCILLRLLVAWGLTISVPSCAPQQPYILSNTMTEPCHQSLSQL